MYFLRMKLFVRVFWVIIAIIAMMTITSCAMRIHTYRDVETKIVSTDNSGIFYLRVQGIGNSPHSAYKNSCKRAVHDLLFKQRLHSEGVYTQIGPIFNNPSIERDNEVFFNRFFSEGGDYEKFVIGNRYIGKRFARKKRSNTGVSYLYTQNVKIDRTGLKIYMQRNGLLPCK